MANTSRLVLMRHAKSDWLSGEGDDFARPLAERGIRDARQMGQWLRASGYLPDAILSSPSRRTRQTLELMADSTGLDLGARTEWLDELYHASVATLRQALRRMRGPSSVMMLGHNPGLEEFLAFLVDDDRALANHGKCFPTAAVYVLDVKGGWDEVKAGCARLIAHQRPRMLAP
jgi:phosphohistidine phosphatase